MITANAGMIQYLGFEEVKIRAAVIYIAIYLFNSSLSAAFPINQKA